MKILFSIVFLIGCAAPNNVVHLTNADSGWFAMGSGNFYYPYWCTIKQVSGKDPEPICYEASKLENPKASPIRNSSKYSQ